MSAKVLRGREQGCRRRAGLEYELRPLYGGRAMPGFGPHHEAVLEVLDCLHNFPFLTGKHLPPRLRRYVRVVDRIDTDQVYCGMGGCRLAHIDDDGSYFHYLEDRDFEARHAAKKVLSNEGSEQFRKIWDANLEVIIGPRLPFEFFPIVHWIAHDLAGIAYWRAGVGRDESSFWERNFQVFLAGGMPVGYDHDPQLQGINVTILACFPGLLPVGERPKYGPTFGQWVEAHYIKDDRPPA